MYDENNLLFVADAPTVVGASDSISFDGFAPHRIVFETDSADEFAAAIIVTQDGTNVNSLFTCIDCAPGSQSVAIDNIYLDNVADTGQSASACDTSCEFVRSGTTVTKLSWTIDNTFESGTDGDIGFTFVDSSGTILFDQSAASTAYPGSLVFLGIIDKLSLEAQTDEFAANFVLTENGVDITQEFRCSDCTEVTVELSNVLVDDDTSAETGVTRCDVDCEFRRFGKSYVK